MTRQIVLVCVGAVLLGATLGALAFVLTDDDPAAAPLLPAVATATATAPPAGTPAPVATAAPRRALPSPAELRALADRVAASEEGRVQIAIARAGSPRAVAVASSGSTRTPFRMWSVSKVATAIALLEAHREAGGSPPPDTRAAMEQALVGSGDCAQRQMTVELQELAGGAEPARTRIQSVLERAGAAGAIVLAREAVAGVGCRPYLEQRSRIPDPYRSALQVGTAEWTIRDVARFALALGDGTYARPTTTRVLDLLREPKRKSDDPFANGLDVTTDPRWGAGLALDGLRSAYKAGWGGSSGETATFVNEQAIHVVAADGRRFGIGVTFEGPDIPVRDDPALTRAPQAFGKVLRGLRRMLRLDG